MIRAVLIVLEILGFLFFFLPVMGILYLIRRTNRQKAGEMAQNIVVKVLRLVLFITRTRVEVRGLENIPKEEALLFVSNHRSDFDIVIAYTQTPKRLGFVAKQEMQSLALLAQWMELLDCIFLNRKDIRQGMQAILQGIENIRRGTSMWVFPEGTRSSELPVTEPREFKEGAFKMAEKSACAILPVAIYGSEQIFEAQKPRIKTATVIIEYLPPVYISELGEDQRKRPGAYSRQKIIEALDRIQKEQTELTA